MSSPLSAPQSVPVSNLRRTSVETPSHAMGMLLDPDSARQSLRDTQKQVSDVKCEFHRRELLTKISGQHAPGAPLTAN